MDGINEIDINYKRDTRYKNKFGRNPAYVNHSRIWIDAGTVNIKTYRNLNGA